MNLLANLMIVVGLGWAIIGVRGLVASRRSRSQREEKS